MKKSGFSRVILFSVFVTLISCTGSNTTTDKSDSTISIEIVGEVGSEKITYSELKDSFTNGPVRNEISLKDLQDFLPIFLDYKAKLMSAKDAGYYENPTILSEFDLYAKQAAYSYWLENKIRPTLFEEFKSRYDFEMKSSHVLVSLGTNPTPEDTLEVYNTMIEARNKFLAGTSTMNELNEEYSSSSQGQKMGGELPWFGIGTTVKPFEDVLYSLKVGEISMPFRTQFGYHIVLLEEKREKKPGREVSHIFARPSSSVSVLDSAYNKLQAGEDWSEIVKEYTQDTPSASTGGKIGWINYGSRYRGDFIDSVMTLDPSMEYSKPFRSSYGFHIIKIDSVQTFENEQARNDYIMSELENSRNFRKNNAFIVDWLLDNYNGYENEEVLNKAKSFLSVVDSASFDNPGFPEGLESSIIFSFNEENYSVKDYYDYLVSTGKKPKHVSYRNSWLGEYKESIVDSEITSMALVEFSDFSDQVDNYRNGLIVYQINEDSVWSAATVDSTILMNIYTNNPEEYSYGTRYFYHLVTQPVSM